MDNKRIDFLKNIDGWNEFCELKLENDAACTKALFLADWITKMNRMPNKRSEDLTEKELGNWLVQMRKAKKDFKAGLKGAGVRTWYPEIEDILTAAGYPDIFESDDLKKAAIDMAYKLRDWLVVNNEQKED
jgi:hypothetical protein